MTAARHWMARHDGRLEEAGEVVLIGGWAEVTFDQEFAAAAATTDYQVFLTSCDAAPVFVRNRRPQSLESHALSGQVPKRKRSLRCAFRVLAWCRGPAG